MGGSDNVIETGTMGGDVIPHHRPGPLTYPSRDDSEPYALNAMHSFCVHVYGYFSGLARKIFLCYLSWLPVVTIVAKAVPISEPFRHFCFKSTWRGRVEYLWVH